MSDARLELRRHDDIYAIDGGWFRARWHFSFDQYYDPEHMGIGTLRVFNHDTLVPGAIWPMHPHRDIEGITYVVKGEFEHADSLGNGGVLLPGGVQRMRLGSGAQHSERNHSPDHEMQFIQMWILPDTQGLSPDIQQHQFNEEDRTDRLLQILHPAGTNENGLDVHQEARMYVARLSAGVEVAHEFPVGHVGYLYLLQGRMVVNGAEMRSGDASYVRTDGAVLIQARSTCEAILVDTTA